MYIIRRLFSRYGCSKNALRLVWRVYAVPFWTGGFLVRTHNGDNIIQWIAYTTRMQYWLEKAEITLRECRLGGYKHADWYTRCED